MSIASKALTKLASPKWGASCVVGVAAALVWAGIFAYFLQGDSNTNTALSVLRQRWPFVVAGVFLLSGLSFHLFRQTKAAPSAYPSLKTPENAKIYLTAQLLIGLYDETVFSETELATSSLPVVLLNTHYRDTARLAEEQSETLLAPMHFQPAIVHRNSIAASGFETQMEQFTTALNTLRAHPKANDIHLFQGVLETSDGQENMQLIPWAFTLRSVGHHTPKTENKSARSLQSLEALIKTCSMPLPLCIAKWLTP